MKLILSSLLIFLGATAIFVVQGCNKKKQKSGLVPAYIWVNNNGATCIYAGDPITFDVNKGAAMEPGDEYAWSFGDGTSASTRSAVHTYSNPGIYEVSVVLNDYKNNPGKVTLQILSHLTSPYTAHIGGTRSWSGNYSEWGMGDSVFVNDSALTIEVVDDGCIRFFGAEMHIQSINEADSIIYYVACNEHAIVRYHYAGDSIIYTYWRQTGKMNYSTRKLHTP